MSFDIQAKEVVEQKYLAQIESLAAKWECEKNSALHDQLLRYLHDLSEPMTVHDHIVAIRALLEKGLLEGRLQFSLKLKDEPQSVRQEETAQDEADGTGREASTLTATQLYERLCDSIEKNRLNFEDLCGALIREVNAAKDAFVLNDNNRFNEVQSAFLEAKNNLAELERRVSDLNQENEALKTQIKACLEDRQNTVQKLSKV